MTYRTRRIIFWALVGLFIIISPLTVFYSKGYRFDFQKWEVFKIGGLNLQIKINDAKIFINNRLKAQSGGLLYSSNFFKLLPGTYKIRIAKENYQDWQKDLTVKPNLVTDAYNIILFPQKTQVTQITNEPAAFFLFSPNNVKILLAALDATSSLTAIKISLTDKKGNPIENPYIFPLKGLKNPQVKILDGRWSANSDSFILKIEVNKKIQWLTLTHNSKNREPALIDEEIKKSLETFKKTVGPPKISASLDELFFNPANPKELLFLAGDDIYAFDLETKIIKNAKINNNPALGVELFYVEGKNVWWIDKTGIIKKNDLNVNLIKEIFRIPNFATSSADNYRFVAWDDTFGIYTKNGIYLYAKKSGGEFIFLEGQITLAKFSPDGKKLLYLKNGEAVVQYLEDIKTGDIKKVGDQELIMNGVKNAAWLKTSDYLILVIDNSINIAELDGRSDRNIFEIIKTEPSIIFYNPDNDQIYYLDDDGLLKTASLK